MRCLMTMICTAVLAVPSAPVLAGEITFPPLRHGIKAVFGPNGNDHGGDFEGYIPGLVRGFHDLNVDLTRIEFKWAIIEPERGTYDWSELDRLIDFLHAYEIEPMLMLYCAPKWAMRGSPEDEELFIRRGEQNLHTVVWPRREFIEDFERFCEAAARRYAGKARLFEFWNEPDGMAGPVVLHDKTGRAVDIRYGGDAKEYTWWLKRMYRAIKRGNPNAKVAAGSLCHHDLYFISTIYAAGGKDYLDAISLHPYAHDGVNLDWIRDVRGVMTQYGDWDKPIWLSEFGWITEGDYDASTGQWPAAAEVQARIVRETFPKIEAVPYITHSFFFTLNDWNTSETGIDPVGTHRFGVMDLQHNRRPSFEAFRKVVAETSCDPRRAETPVPTIAPPPGPIDMTDDGTFTVASQYFSTEPGPEPRPAPEQIALAFAAPDLFDEVIRVEVPLGRHATPRRGITTTASPVRDVRWQVTLPVTHAVEPGTYPITIELPGAPAVDGLITQPAAARRFETPPTIDADLADWRGRLDIRRERMIAGFGWDERNVYFACRMIDDHHQQPHTDHNIWRGDCVQLAFDPERDAIRGSKYDDNDSEFAMALSGDEPILWRYACQLGSYVGRMPDAWVAVRREGNMTFYEAAIPWDEIAVRSPEPGRIVGVSVAGCDWTGDERAVHRFGDGIIGHKHPAIFASIRLLDAPAER